MSPHLPTLPLSRRIFRELRTEGGGRVREAVAVGLGVFIGCLPLFGLHLLLVVACGWLFRLNRLKMYIAANISNPLFAPFLILTEIQLGALLRRGDVHQLSSEVIRHTDPSSFGLDLVAGSLAFGVMGGLVAGLATCLTARCSRPNGLDDVLKAAADRYLERGITAWEFARGKLRRDPIYGAALTAGVLPAGGTLIDIGCGQGLMLAALAESRSHLAAGAWPLGVPEPPVFEKLIGIELRPRIAALAAKTLREDATIMTGDAATLTIEPASAFLLFDVLHMIPHTEQEALLRAVKQRLRPGGVVLVREADASAGSGFGFVRLGNRLKAVFTGNWRQRFAFRRNSEWQALFASLGYQADPRDMSTGTPFANIMFVLRHDAVSGAGGSLRS